MISLILETLRFLLKSKKFSQLIQAHNSVPIFISGFEELLFLANQSEIKVKKMNFHENLMLNLYH